MVFVFCNQNIAFSWILCIVGGACVLRDNINQHVLDTYYVLGILLSIFYEKWNFVCNNNPER